MTTDTLPAAVTDAAAPVTLDGARVHRDWRQLGAEAAGITTAVTAAGALYTATFQVTPVLMWALAVGCAVAVVALIVLLTLMRREGRRWTLAVDVDPS
ncbi:hypothetical protein [Micromonospora carbonacea]|uniref:Uncharacterized protein n=1 Tax=Micromonospora carbonacea TaxID=47853 RepID=A0A1C5ABB1_9ACTN|nr:hypothetical protein [Micromonospora carbonacea]SCF42449.1 hypothetical protein GA0070563_11280 [Micromonospora carbonacea]